VKSAAKRRRHTARSRSAESVTREVIDVNTKECDLCRRKITEAQEIEAVTMNVDGGMECSQDDEGTDYDLHAACWKKIKAMLRKTW
jgi:hypothetical protein